MHQLEPEQGTLAATLQCSVSHQEAVASVTKQNTAPCVSEKTTLLVANERVFVMSRPYQEQSELNFCHCDACRTPF